MKEKFLNVFRRKPDKASKINCEIALGEIRHYLEKNPKACIAVYDDAQERFYIKHLRALQEEMSKISLEDKDQITIKKSEIETAKNTLGHISETKRRMKIQDPCYGKFLEEASGLLDEFENSCLKRLSERYGILPAMANFCSQVQILASEVSSSRS